MHLLRAGGNCIGGTGILGVQGDNDHLKDLNLDMHAEDHCSTFMQPLSLIPNMHLVKAYYQSTCAIILTWVNDP